MKLISMTEFVLEQKRPIPSADLHEADYYQQEYEVLEKVCNYANFLNQPLTLGMFVPCDEDGNVFEEPNINDFKSEPFCTTGNCQAYRDEIEIYQQAKDKVLFKSRDEFRDWDYTDIENSKIEDLITDGFEYVLNENAIKQIKL